MGQAFQANQWVRVIGAFPKNKGHKTPHHAPKNRPAAFGGQGVWGVKSPILFFENFIGVFHFAGDGINEGFVYVSCACVLAVFVSAFSG